MVSLCTAYIRIPGVWLVHRYLRQHLVSGLSQKAAPRHHEQGNNVEMTTVLSDSDTVNKSRSAGFIDFHWTLSRLGLARSILFWMSSLLGRASLLPCTCSEGSLKYVCLICIHIGKVSAPEYKESKLTSGDPL